MKFRHFVAQGMLAACFLPMLSMTPAQARETVLTPIEDAPYQSRLGDCFSSRTPVLYGHRDFRGAIHRINRSENRLSGGLNNIFSSACVPEGWAMTVYKKADFNGRSLTIGPGQVTTRFRDELNNETTSVRIFRVHENGNWVEQ